MRALIMVALVACAAPTDAGAGGIGTPASTTTIQVFADDGPTPAAVEPKYIDEGYTDDLVEAVTDDGIVFRDGVQWEIGEIEGEDCDAFQALRANGSGINISCACACGAPSVCNGTVTIDGKTANCEGDCSGIDSNGRPSNGCSFLCRPLLDSGFVAERSFIAGEGEVASIDG